MYASSIVEKRGWKQEIMILLQKYFSFKILNCFKLSFLGSCSSLPPSPLPPPWRKKSIKPVLLKAWRTSSTMQKHQQFLLKNVSLFSFIWDDLSKDELSNEGLNFTWQLVSPHCAGLSVLRKLHQYFLRNCTHLQSCSLFDLTTTSSCFWHCHSTDK